MLIGLLKSSNICYNSLNFFMEGIEQALNCRDIQTEWIEEISEQILYKKWDAIIGINNTLPSEKLEDGTFLVDLFECPFFDILVDAPYYHHNTLKEHATNLHVIVLDEGHVEYCKKYYQPLRSVSMACLLGPVEKEIPYKARKIDVLFAGSLVDINEYRQKVHLDYGDRWQAAIYEKIIEVSIENPNMTTSQVIDMILKANSVQCNDSEWKSLMNYFGVYAEFYLRGYYREKIITGLINHGLNVHVVGEGWERLYCQAPENLKVHSGVGFSEIARMTANAKVSLNVMPWFKDGMHDRIVSALMNGTVCVTDGSSYINSHFVDNEELLIYDLKKIEELPSRIEAILKDDERAQGIAKRGMKKALEDYSWNRIVEENILKYIEKL